MEKTLREVCDEVKVTRRAVQGYEKAGLVTPSGHNERGYLLYDEIARARIEQIKIYQDMGFTIKEIANSIDGPRENLKQTLNQKVLKLQEEREHLEKMICLAEEMLSRL